MDDDADVRPEHYQHGKIEVWDAIVLLRLNYLAGNVVKYLCRYKYKGSRITDLRKAREYLDKLIDVETKDIEQTNQHS